MKYIFILWILHSTSWVVTVPTPVPRISATVTKESDEYPLHRGRENEFYDVYPPISGLLNDSSNLNLLTSSLDSLVFIETSEQILLEETTKHKLIYLGESVQDSQHPLIESTKDSFRPLVESTKDSHRPLEKSINDSHRHLVESAEDSYHPMVASAEDSQQPLVEYTENSQDPLVESTKDSHRLLVESTKDFHRHLVESTKDSYRPLEEFTKDSDHPLEEFTKDSDHPLEKSIKDSQPHLVKSTNYSHPFMKESKPELSPTYNLSTSSSPTTSRPERYSPPESRSSLSSPSPLLSSTPSSLVSSIASMSVEASTGSSMLSSTGLGEPSEASSAESGPSSPSPSVNSEEMTSVETTDPSTQPADDGSPHPLPGWALALISLAVVTVILTGVFILFLKYRRSRIPLAKPVATIFRKSTVARSPEPIRKTSFHREYQVRLSSSGLSEEFERVQEYSARVNATKSRKIGQEEKNRNRNRFVDILPFDDNYVKLGHEEGSPPSDYVNASIIENIPGVRRMIATQGPKQNTVVEFWRMVLEKGSRHIINLTNCMEGGRVKCYQYWPPNGQMLHFDDISLFTQDETEIHPGLFLRKIEVQLGDEPECDSHVVEQLHLTTWPDHGVPSNINALLAFMRVTLTFGGQGYSLVHCSAGVGRTGTFLALRSLLHQAEERQSLDIMKTVFKLRELRPKLVQTFEQYALLYQVLDVFLRMQDSGADQPPVLTSDDVLDAGIDNFGFEHVKL